MKNVKFDDALPLLVRALVDLDIDTSDFVVVRDQRGRLLVACEKLADRCQEVRQQLLNLLGKYAAAPFLIFGEMAGKAKESSAVRKILVEGYTIQLLDRRIVGADWLSLPADAQKGPVRLVFGSLKGGVGRSTALAVLAADLAQAGKKVLAIDLDLEAPGIGYIFLPECDADGQDRRPKFGVIDYLVENSLGGIADDELYDFIGVSKLGEGSIDVVPAVGRVTDDSPQNMLSKLSRALVEDNDNNGGVVSVSMQIQEMISRFTQRTSYDAVLIDARAGLAEVSAAPLLSLGAEVLLFGVAQPQTYRGYSYLLAHVSSLLSQEEGSYEFWRERLHFVHAKAPSSAAKRDPFREKIYEICSAHLYEEELLDDHGSVIQVSFSPSPSEIGNGVPHDALYILGNQDYFEFDPLSDYSQLHEDVYRGPFGAFIQRAWELLGLERSA